MDFWGHSELLMDFKKNLGQVGKMYVVCTILRNALTCLYGNITSTFFGLKPPKLDVYFQ